MPKTDIFVPRILNMGDSELVDIAEIKPHPENVNEGDRKTIEALIREHGFWGSVICQKSTRYILAGNHLAAYQSVGRDPIQSAPQWQRYRVRGFRTANPYGFFFSIAILLTTILNFFYGGTK